MGMYSPPDPPDPVKTAEAQAGLNERTAITQYLLGATNQKTPFGSLTYTPMGTWGEAFGQPKQAQTGELWGGNSAQTPAALAKTREEQILEQNRATQAERVNGFSGGPSSFGAPPPPAAQAGSSGATGTPFGSGDYMDLPRFQVEQTLSPELQGIVDNFLSTGRNLSGTISNTLSQQLDTSRLPARAQNLVGGQGLQNVGLDLSWAGPEARYDIANAGPIQRDVGPSDYSEDRQRVEEALLSRINPQLDRDRSRLEADLRARGMAPGSGQAYNGAVDELNRAATDARYGAILAGGQEQSRLAGLDLAQGQFRNAAQAQQYGQNANDASFYNSAQQQNWQQRYAGDQFTREGILANNNTQNLGFNQQLAAANFNNSNRSGALEEAAFLRSLPLNELSALMSGTQLAGPKFTNTPQPGVNGVDYTGLVNQQYQAKAQAHQGMLGGLGGIGSALIGMLPFSDRRVKRNIRRVGSLRNGLNVYSYDKFGRPEIGLMADEVKRIRPFAVKRHASGFDVVDYAQAVA